ncbi:hypothetical protein MalM25_28330 [Planctomycetes bacterium MalM25]|nr:hypothetical protein MalM25_28330 [Planctomycetes bacterium MalM25]
MDLIRVQCETCQTWLRVRGEGFVGEVHACPRCGSMVLIASTPAALPETAEAATPAPTLGLSDTLETFEPPPEPETTEPEPLAETPEPVEALAEPTASLGSWAPIATTAAALMATSALVGAWWVAGSPTGEVAQTERAQTEGASSVALPGEAEGGRSAAVEPSVVKSVVEPVEPVVAVEEPEPVVEADGAAEPNAFELPPTPEVEPVPPASAPAAATPPTSVAPLSDGPPTAIDPLAIDPTEIELVLRRGDGSASSPGAEPSEPASPPTPAETPPPAEPSLDERLAQAGAQAGIFVRLGPTDASTGPPNASADKALTQVVPSIELRAIPLDEAVRLLGELAGTPITLDPAALRRAGVRPNKPIDLIAEDQTLGQILAAGLKQARLRYATDGAHVLVERVGDSQTREITHRLGDLVGGDPQALASELARRLPHEIDLTIGADGALPLNALGRVHFDLLVACETLRAERGLPATSKYPRALLATEPYETAIAPTLDRRTTFSFVSPTPLTEVFDHWRRVTERPILVDWPALASVGIGPRTTVECSVTNRPWRAALDGVLTPLGLTWRADFAGSIWITAAAESPGDELRISVRR